MQISIKKEQITKYFIDLLTPLLPRSYLQQSNMLVGGFIYSCNPSESGLHNPSTIRHFDSIPASNVNNTYCRYDISICQK